MQQAFAQGSRRNLRNDLLLAADSITNTMSSLVKELNSEVGSDTDSISDLTFQMADVFHPQTGSSRIGAAGQEAGGFYRNGLENRLDKELKMEERLRPTQEQDKNFLVTLQE